MNVKIRKAKPEDWKIIQKLNNEVFTVDKPHDEHLNLNWPFSKKGTTYYKSVIKDPKYFCIIAEIDRKPVSYLIGTVKKFSYRTNKTAEIENMGTSPKYRSKGIGTKLIQEFKKWCKQKELTHIYVNSYYKNQKAINFYKKQGFKPIDLSLEGKI